MGSHRHAGRDEIELATELRRGRERLGPERFLEVVASCIAPYEQFLRETQPPSHPALRLLEEQRPSGSSEVA